MSRLNSGILPERLLFTKLIVLSVGKCDKASISMVPERLIFVKWTPFKVPPSHIIPSHCALQGKVFGTQDSRCWLLVRDFLNLRRASDSDIERERGRRERRKRRVAADIVERVSGERWGVFFSPTLFFAGIFLALFFVNAKYRDWFWGCEEGRKWTVVNHWFAF